MFLYAATIFLSAFLLFQIQPMITKIILPWFGGSAAVWITAMLFFQMVLLGGYAYAHWTVRSLKSKRQATLHVILLFASLAVLPVWPSLAFMPEDSGQPTLRILCLLATSVGLPYFLLATTTPLLQAWYSSRYHAVLPYRLFALSNLASLIGLLAYPFLVEPNITLRQQSVSWSCAYAAFVVLVSILSVISIGRMPADTKEAAAESPIHEASGPMPLREQFLCLMLACCASVFMLSVTNHLTQNVASIPFLWILPLTIYLLSFVLTFDLERLYNRKVFLWLLAFSLAGMSLALALWPPGQDIRRVIFVFCLGLLIACIFCHGEVVKRKPAPRYLTSFYLMLSAGGALGGVLVGIVAPLLLPGYFELPLVIIACALLMLITGYRRLWPCTAGFCVLSALLVVYNDSRYIVKYSNSAASLSRNFYGSVRVLALDQGTRNESRALYNGPIVHGLQYTDPDRRRECPMYYRPQSGVSRALRALRPGPLKVGIIGLGAGSLASFAQPGDTFRFYEINPLVENVARKEFSYMAECRGRVDTVIGDGRLAIESEAPQRYHLLVVDAFSGDAIPVHLLTVQALRLYFKHIREDGILALHISNTHLDLEPVVEKLANALGKNAVVVVDRDSKGGGSSLWALLAAKPFTAPLIMEAAHPLKSRPELRIWTDDYNNLFQILKRSAST